MYSVCIADDNKIWANTLASFLNRQENFNIVGILSDGLEALNFIIQEKPDILILDIVMPNCDGTSIVNYIYTQMDDYHPIVYILSGIGTNSIIKILNEYNIDFFSMKPTSLEIILENLQRITKANSNNGSQNDIIPEILVIPDIVKQLGLVSDRSSTKCVMMTLEYCINNNEYYGLLTKEVYPEIAKSLKISSSAVERNIRIAIKQMELKNSKLYRELFLQVSRSKITNSEFISVVIHHLKNMVVNN